MKPFLSFWVHQTCWSFAQSYSKSENPADEEFYEPIKEKIEPSIFFLSEKFRDSQLARHVNHEDMFPLICRWVDTPLTFSRLNTVHTVY